MSKSQKLSKLQFQQLKNQFIWIWIWGFFGFFFVVVLFFLRFLIEIEEDPIQNVQFEYQEWQLLPSRGSGGGGRNGWCHLSSAGGTGKDYLAPRAACDEGAEADAPVPTAYQRPRADGG